MGHGTIICDFHGSMTVTYSMASVEFSFLVGSRLGGVRCGSRNIRLGLRVLGLTLIGYFSHIASVSVDAVGNLLQTAIGQGDVVGSAGSVSVSLLVLAVVVVGVVVLDGPAVSVGSRHIGVGRGGAVSWGSVRTRQSCSDGKEAGGGQ